MNAYLRAIKKHPELKRQLEEKLERRRLKAESEQDSTPVAPSSPAE